MSNEPPRRGQDRGGPIGMGALARSPDLLKGAVLLNTGFNAPREAMDLSRAHATVKTPVVGELLLEVFLSIFEQLPRMQGDPDSLPADVVELYGRPVLESGNDKAPLAMLRMVTDGPDHPSTPAMRVIEGYVQDLDIPAEIVWGMNDPILARGLRCRHGGFFCLAGDALCNPCCDRVGSRRNRAPHADAVQRVGDRLSARERRATLPIRWLRWYPPVRWLPRSGGYVLVRSRRCSPPTRRSTSSAMVAWEPARAFQCFCCR